MTRAASELLEQLTKDDRLAKFAVSETGFLFDPQTGQSFTLNSTGLITLTQLKRGDDVADVAMHLSERFRVSQETALSSIEAFLVQLGRYL